MLEESWKRQGRALLINHTSELMSRRQGKKVWQTGLLHFCPGILFFLGVEA